MFEGVWMCWQVGSTSFFNTCQLFTAKERKIVTDIWEISEKWLRSFENSKAGCWRESGYTRRNQWQKRWSGVSPVTPPRMLKNLAGTDTCTWEGQMRLVMALFDHINYIRILFAVDVLGLAIGGNYYSGESWLHDKMYHWHTWSTRTACVGVFASVGSRSQQILNLCGQVSLREFARV